MRPNALLARWRAELQRGYSQFFHQALMSNLKATYYSTLPHQASPKDSLGDSQVHCGLLGGTTVRLRGGFSESAGPSCPLI
jgi:hypothetical protein